MDKFKITEGTDGRKRLLFDSSYPKECCDFAVANNIKYLTLYPGCYTHANLDPILPLKDFIEGLLLHEEVDFGKIFQFQKLKFLGALDNKKNVLNLNSFPNLEVLACNITERLIGLEGCDNLKSLTISYYNPKCESLIEIPTLDSLEQLSVIKTKIRSLNGIERFRRLEKFEIYSAPVLNTVSALLGLSGNLLEASFDSCRKVSDFEALGGVRSLKKIILTNSGSIKSLFFVRALDDLEFISFFGTNIVDGDVSHCEGIEYVGFDDKKHYSHKMAHFKHEQD